MAFVADTLSPLLAGSPAALGGNRARPVLSPNGAAALMLAGAALFWSGNFLAGRLVADALPPATFSAARWILAFALLLPFTFGELRGKGRALIRHWPLWVAAGVLNICVFTVLIYAGLAHTTLVNGSLIGASAPIVVGLLGWLVLRDRVSGRQRLALGVSTLGIGLIVARGDIAHLTGLSFNAGDLVLFLGISAFAFYTVLLKRFPCGLSAGAALTASVPFGLMALLPFAAWEIVANGIELKAFTNAAPSILYVATLPTAGFVLWARGVAVLGPTRAGQFLQLVPVFGAVLAVGLLGESLHLYHAAGLALVLGGLALRDPG